VSTHHVLCHAEFIDGVWDTSMCGCPECIDDEHDEIERQYETGAITLAEALDAHDRIDSWGGCS
jgi:hypothetical protein